MPAGCWKGIPSEDLTREVDSYFPECIALNNKVFG